MTKPAIRVLKQPPRPMGVPPIRRGVLQQKLLGEQTVHEPLTIAVAQKNLEVGNDGPDTYIAPSREGWVEAPLEPTEAMILAAERHVRASEDSDPLAAAKDIYTAMINARFDEPPVDTQALFGASSSEIKAALTLYRKMKAPRKRRKQDANSD